MSVSVRGPFIKSVGSRICGGMPHVAMQTRSMTCAVRGQRDTLSVEAFLVRVSVHFWVV